MLRAPIIGKGKEPYVSVHIQRFTQSDPGGGH
jgi:hypothetical protein